MMRVFYLKLALASNLADLKVLIQYDLTIINLKTYKSTKNFLFHHINNYNLFKFFIKSFSLVPSYLYIIDKLSLKFYFLI